MLPRYSVAEAAQYIRVPTATLTTWVKGRPARAGERGAAPVIVLPPSATLLSFQNLVEAHVLGSIRRQHGVSLQRVRKALLFVRKKLNQAHPLITAKFETDGVDLFVLELGRLLNVSAGGQTAIREALQASLRRVEHDPDGLAGRLFPLVRSTGGDEPRAIVVDARVSFGRPVLVKTGVPTSVVFGRLKAGESIESIAGDYGIGIEQIADAVRCEVPAAA